MQALLPLAVLRSGKFGDLVTFSGAGMALFGGLVMLSVFPLRRRGMLPGAFATPLYPLPPIVYLLVLVWMVGSAMRSEVGPPLLGIAAIVAMWLIYLVCERLRRR